MKIIIDRNIPFIKGLLEPYAEVCYMPGGLIGPEDVRDTDALIVRTRTRCDSSLLAGSRVKLVVTATIGMDHIDLGYCRDNGIETVNAPGCNAPGVAQYVFAAINRLKPEARSIGIVGVGHVGSIVERWGRSMGFDVLLNDPPREALEGSGKFCSLEDIAAIADVITFHTPLDASTRHLADTVFFSSLRHSPLVINAARGGVVNERVALEALRSGLVSNLAIDCWEGEPEINRDLLRDAAIATPHIAGYSLEGKIRATQMALDAVTRHFDLPRITVNEPLPGPVPATMTLSRVAESYDILADSVRLKESPTAFEKLRNNYDYRHEP